MRHPRAAGTRSLRCLRLASRLGGFAQLTREEIVLPRYTRTQIAKKYTSLGSTNTTNQHPKFHLVPFHIISRISTIIAVILNPSQPTIPPFLHRCRSEVATLALRRTPDPPVRINGFNHCAVMDSQWNSSKIGMNTNRYIMMLNDFVIEGSLEAKLPTIWRDGNGTARKKLGRGESQEGETRTWRRSEGRR